VAHIGFKALKAELAAKPGVYDPGALAAHIGRRKYGAAGMATMAAVGRAKKRTARDLMKSAKQS
jgi:hypothetical protein